MAIQVSGTTVIDDSRNLTNIASVDATTVTAIGAAGVGGGGTHDFVASGAISNGDVVVLNSDGTVSVVTGASQSTGTPSTMSNIQGTQVSAAFDSTNNKVIVVVRNGYNSSFGTAVVGTVSGTSISFGTPVVFESNYTWDPSVTFDINTGKVVVAYTMSSVGYARVGTVSGTSISFGSSVIFENADANYITATYDSTNNKTIITYRDNGNTGSGTAVVGTVSGTSVSFGTPVVFNSGDTEEISSTFDSTNGKLVVVYRDDTNSFYGTAIVGTVSGTSISFGSPVVYATTQAEDNGVAFDSTNNKVIVVYKQAAVSDDGVALVGTISGTSISFGTEVVFATAITETAITYDVNANRVNVVYQDDNNSDYGTLIVGTVSGTSISFGTPVVFETALTSNIAATYDSSSNKVVIAYRDAGNSNYATGIVFQNAFTDASSYIGIAAEAISDTATGEITITSGINEGQTGLTIGQSYFIADDGTLTTTNNGRKIGEAISTTNLQVKTKLTGSEMDEYLGGLV